MNVVEEGAPADEPCTHAPGAHAGRAPVHPPLDLVMAQTEKRLNKELRLAAQCRDPDEIRVRAIVRSFSGAQSRLWHALADLAATGGEAAELLELSPHVGPSTLATLAAKRLPGVQADDERLLRHAARVCQRTERVRAYVAAEQPERERMRASLPELAGWIGVSGEDDPPRRPVNVPSSRHPTFCARVRVGHHELRVRYLWAGPDDGSAKLVVLMHGHSSRLEEMDGLIAKMQARAPGQYCFAVADFPSQGYSERVDHEELTEGIESRTPVLEFLERFMRAFVRQVCDERSIPAAVACIGGGSLAGNLALRLAERPRPWARSFAAWSPASVWSSMEGDILKGCALRVTRERLEEYESDDSRRAYFQAVFAERIFGTGRTQPQMWYRDSWGASGGCRAAAIAGALRDRREYYDEAFRRMHWRLAHEQLVFSHVRQADGSVPFLNIRGPLLLMAGAEDNFLWTHIHDRTRDIGLALAAKGVPGRCVLLGDTGHSIHDERPDRVAREIVEFLRRRI